MPENAVLQALQTVKGGTSQLTILIMPCDLYHLPPILSPLLACKSTNIVYGFGCLSHSAMKTIEGEAKFTLVVCNYISVGPQFLDTICKFVE